MRHLAIPGRRIRWASYVVAWVPFAIVYGAIVAVARGTAYAVVVTTAVVGMASLLGVVAWWVSGTSRATERPTYRLIATHLVLAVAYGVAVQTCEFAVTAWLRGVPFASLVGRFKTFEILSAVFGYTWLYCVVAGLAHAIRASREAKVRELAAARAETLAAAAQLRALRAQLNPHFLFNALHSLSALVRHDPAAAESAIDHLGDMLRYALDEGGGDDTALAEEWSFTEHYLALEKLRLGERLTVKVDLQEEALDVVVPCFVLQPLVENAVRHGIAPRPSGGTVSVSARLDGDTLAIRVSDDGSGTDPTSVGDSGGLGLRALGRRLEARYGGRAVFDIHTAPGAGFAATLLLPQGLPAR